MRRRDLLVLLGATATWPAAASGQSSAMPVVGLLCSASPELWIERLRAFRLGLGEAGFVEGRNVALEFRWAHGRNELLPELAADLVSRKVSAIVVLGGTSSALAAKAATTTIPIVVRGAVDPVEVGLVASLSRPGGNLTGVTTLGVETGPKQLELIHELLPAVRVVGLLVNQTNPVVATLQSQNVPAVAGRMGLEIHVLKASTDAEIEAAFSSIKSLRVGALVVGVDAFFNSRNEMLAALALRHAMPTVSAYPEFAAAGGLMSYGGSIPHAARLVGTYTGRILKGEMPAGLPFQQAAKIDLIINLATAKTLGIVIPSSLLARADEVIE